LSVLLNSTKYLKYLNLLMNDKVYDYYSQIYEEYGGFKGINEGHGRKLVKKAIMTVNYGLTRIGCHRKMYNLLVEYGYCKDWADYKLKWKAEIERFYEFISQTELVKALDLLQKIWNLYCSKRITYAFKIGKYGLVNSYIMKSKTYTYRKYYKNFSLYSKSSKQKVGGMKYMWSRKTLDKIAQKRKVKANLIHMMDANWNLSVLDFYEYDIVSIHDCHAVHSCNVDYYNGVVRDQFINMFSDENQYYKLLLDMLEEYYKQTNDIINYNIYRPLIEEFKVGVNQRINLFFIKGAKYMFVPK